MGRWCWSAVAVVLVLVSSPAVQAAAPAESADTLDFRAIISQAKKQVFPALIFVKPIVEEYGTGRKKQREVFGSGVIIAPEGLAITNHHVIDKAVAINCVLFDKRQVKAELVGSDKDTDLALLRLQLPEDEGDLPYGRFAAEPVSEGDFVMALGSPFGFQRSISLGIISNAQRYIGFKTSYKYNTWLQTDAPINPGNSGGPLINTSGEIVGINTLGLMGTSLGFSIPSAVVQDIVKELREHGAVERAHTGLRLQALNDFHSNTFVDSDSGVLITGVEEDSPAASAGIAAGDILLTIDGAEVDGAYAEMLPKIWRQLAKLPRDREIVFGLRRAGEPLELKLSVEKKGKVQGDDFDCRRWNLTVKDINKYETARLHYLYGQGVYVYAVRYPGNAAKAGLSQQDVIVKIDNQEVKTLDDIKNVYEAVMADEEREKRVMFEIERNRLRRWIVVDYRKDYDKE